MSEALRVKKPKSNFLLFCEDQRAELKVSRPELKSTEIVQECSRLWKELSEEKKDVYNKKYQALKDSLPKVEKPEKPKSNRPKSAYINFCTLERARIRALHDGLGPKELMKKIAEEWALLSLEQKDKFKTEALEQARKEEQEKKKVQEKKDEEKKSVGKKKSSK